MRDQIQAFLDHIASRRSSRTASTYGTILTSFARFTSSAAPTRRDVEAFLGRPRRDGRTGSPATRNQELAALRAFAKFAQRDLAWTSNPTDGVPFAREAPRDPPVLSMPELRRMFTTAASDEEPSARARGLAVLAVLSQAGLRVHELVALDMAQLDVASATLVGVRGKGGTMHDVPLNGATVTLLLDWLADRSTIAPKEEPALFVSRTGRRLSIRSVQRHVERLRGQIGTAKRITPHTFRHTTATLALTLGADLSTVADLLRHSDLNTTRRYLHLVDERRREAVGRLGAAIPAELLHETNDGEAAGSTSGSTGTGGLDVQHGLGDGMSVEGRAEAA